MSKRHFEDVTLLNGDQEKQMNYARIGSISSGTMRTEDLLDTFADVLEDCVRRNADEWCSDEGRRERDAHLSLVRRAQEYTGGDDDDDGEEGEDLVAELFDALEAFAAPYTYFGAHEGDGADYGFWPSFYHLDEDVRCGEVLQVSDTSEVPDDYRGLVMHVNDHGNVTLYQANGSGHIFTELWSCV